MVSARCAVKYTKNGSIRTIFFSGKESSDGLSFWVDGFLAPVIELRRPLSYTFVVRGGSDHPLYFTTDPVGGLRNMTSAQRQKHKYFAGHTSGYASVLSLFLLSVYRIETHEPFLVNSCSGTCVSVLESKTCLRVQSFCVLLRTTHSLLR